MPHSPAPSPWRAEIAATLQLAGPLVMANLLQMAVFGVDVIFVARLGAASLAASSLAVSLFSLMMWCFSSMTGAVTALISAELGQRRHAVREVRRSLRMALWLAVFCAVIGMAACQLGERVMLATGQDPHIAAQAQGFLVMLSLSILPGILSNVLRSFVAAMGRPYFATAITALAILANTLGNYAFVFGHLGAPAMGLTGSAISTLLTALVTLAAYVMAIGTDRRLRRYQVFGRWWRPEWQRLRDLCRIGLPIALTIIAEGGLFSSAAFLMGRIGPTELAAHTIALQIAAVFFQLPFGIGQAATIRVGYHFGSSDRAAIARAGSAALGTCIGTQLFSAALMLMVPGLIISAYVDVTAPANAAMVVLATQYLIVAAAFQMFDGIQAVICGALRGLQDTRAPMLIAISGYWLVGFPLAAGLGLFTALAGLGVWLGLMAGLVVVAALLMIRWRQRDRLGLVPL